MTKDVIISILSSQDHLEGGPDEIRLMSTGATYQVTEVGTLGVTEMSPVDALSAGEVGYLTASIKSVVRVTLMRTGEVCSQMVFEEGRRHHSVYSTPYGNLEIGIVTSRLENTISPQGGRLEIEYSMEIDHALAGYNAFRISVRERGEGQ